MNGARGKDRDQAIHRGCGSPGGLFSCCAPEMQRSRRDIHTVKVYLALYDAVLFLGWATVGLWMLMRVGQEGLGWLGRAWAELSAAMYLMQALVLLDVIHGVIGFWGSSDIPLLKRIWCKVGRRTELFVTLTLLHITAQPLNALGSDSAKHALYYSTLALSHWALGATFVTWAVTDVIRYPFYACSSLGLKPSWLVWLRYSVFIPQYPAVVLCELLVVWHALPAILQIGLLQLEGPFGPLTVLGAEMFPAMDRVCLLSYAWVAVLFQVRNVALFSGYFRTLWGVRNVRLGIHAEKGTPRPLESAVDVQDSSALTTTEEKKQMDELLRCDVPTIAIPSRLRKGR